MAGRARTTDHERLRGEALARLIQLARQQLGRTQRELAEQAEIPVDTLRAIEGGRSASPSFFTVSALARILNLGLDDVARQTMGRRR